MQKSYKFDFSIQFQLLNCIFCTNNICMYKIKVCEFACIFTIGLVDDDPHYNGSAFSKKISIFKAINNFSLFNFNVLFYSSKIMAVNPIKHVLMYINHVDNLSNRFSTKSNQFK